MAIFNGNGKSSFPNISTGKSHYFHGHVQQEWKIFISKQFLMGNLIISMAMFNSYVSHNQRVYQPYSQIIHILTRNYPQIIAYIIHMFVKDMGLIKKHGCGGYVVALPSRTCPWEGAVQSVADTYSCGEGPVQPGIRLVISPHHTMFNIYIYIYIYTIYSNIHLVSFGISLWHYAFGWWFGTCFSPPAR